MRIASAAAMNVERHTKRARIIAHTLVLVCCAPGLVLASTTAFNVVLPSVRMTVFSRDDWPLEFWFVSFLLAQFTTPVAVVLFLVWRETVFQRARTVKWALAISTVALLVAWNSLN